MRNETTRRDLKTIGLRVLFVALFLTGCTGLQQQAGPPPNESLQERVARYWDARIRGDLLATYRLYEPAFRRAVTFAAFSQGRGATPTLAYEILSERIDGDIAFVTVKSQYTIKHPLLVRPVEPRWAEVEEQWIRVEGAWYRRFRFPVGDPYPPVDWEAIATERQRSIDSQDRP